MKRRGARGYDIVGLPYEARLYGNGQLLVPAKLVRALGLSESRYALVTIRVLNNEATFKARLLKTRRTYSRQFTVPKQLREQLKIREGDSISVIYIAPL